MLLILGGGRAATIAQTRQRKLQGNCSDDSPPDPEKGTLVEEENMNIMLIPVLVSIAFFLRIGLIMTGMLKGPILRTFEKYGGDEELYYPLPALLLWSGVIVLSLTALLVDSASILLPTGVPGLLLLGFAFLARNHPEFAREHPDIFLHYPRWYHQLRARTSRYERRRLSYMWLWLPRRLRLIYNGSDRAFDQWADLVIMASMRYDEEDPTLWRENPPETYEAVYRPGA